MQRKRFRGTKLQSNAEMSSRDIKKYCELSDECQDLLRKAVSLFSLSARSYHKMIKLSRTIADLDNSKNIDVKHMSEAFRYRLKEEE